MKRCIAVGAFAVAALALAGASPGQESLKSGLQIGEHTTPFSPLNVTGANAGKKVCQV
jgi:hypothetical protein